MTLARATPALRSLFAALRRGGASRPLVGCRPNEASALRASDTRDERVASFSSSTQRRHATSSACIALLDVILPRGDHEEDDWTRAAGQPSLGLAAAERRWGGFLTTRNRRRPRSSSSASARCSPTTIGASGKGGQTPRFADFSGCRSMSSSASSVPSRFARDENGKRRRVVGGSGRGGGAGGGTSGGGSGGGGRGGGAGRGTSGGGRVGGGGRGGSRENTRLVNSSIRNAECAQDVLSVVKDNLRELDHIHVSTAFNTLGKLAKSWDVFPRRLATAAADGDEVLRELLHLARHFAQSGQFTAHSAANTTHGIAKLHEAGRLRGISDGSVDGAMAALESDAARVAPTMIAHAVANTFWGYATLGKVPRDDAWAALERAAERTASEMNSQAVANTLWSCATLGILGKMPRDDTLAALEAAAARTASEMNSQAVSTTLWSYGKLGKVPGDDTWAALEAAALRATSVMNPQAMTTTLWSYATLEKMPGEQLLAALEISARRMAPVMKSQDVGMLVWSYATLGKTLGKTPGNDTWAALERAAGRTAPEMNEQSLTNTLWGYATLERRPTDKTWAALEAAAGRLAPAMHPQIVANTLWGYATLGRMPPDDTWAALGKAAWRMAPDMIPQGVANVVWGYAALSTLRGVELPSCYPAAWAAICGFQASSFSRMGLCMLFHTHLMHHFSGPTPSVTVTYPSWLMTEARDAWMTVVQDRNTVSRPQRDIARMFDELNVRHEVERLSDDGYFSMDIYLPDFDVCVEFDGPTHYYNDDDGSRTLKFKTELRDFFLAKQCTKVVTVPYFVFDKVGTSPEKLKAYLRRILAEEAGIELCEK